MAYSQRWFVIGLALGNSREPRRSSIRLATRLQDSSSVLDRTGRGAVRGPRGRFVHGSWRRTIDGSRGRFVHGARWRPVDGSRRRFVHGARWGTVYMGPGGGLSYDGKYRGPWSPCLTGVLGAKWNRENCPGM